MILNLMALIKYSVMLSREKKIRDFIKLLEIDWREAVDSNEEVEIVMRDNAKVGRRLTQVCAVTFYMGGLSYRLIKTLLTPRITTPDGLVTKPLPSPLFGTASYNYSSSPTYEFIFALQMMAGFAVHSTTITTCSYAAVLATHACGQFDMVVYFLNHLIDPRGNSAADTSGDVAARRLRIIVRQHLKVLR